MVDGIGQTEPMDGLERSRMGAREPDQRHRQPDKRPNETKMKMQRRSPQQK